MRTSYRSQLLLLSFGLISESAFASPVPGPTTRIASGTTAAECALPTLVDLGNCTGTLVHPRVVLYANHCGTPSSIRFTNRSGGGFQVGIASCKIRGGSAVSLPSPVDFAYCVLEEPVLDIPLVPVAFGCEQELAKADAKIVQAGFGAVKGSQSGSGIKRWASNTIERVEESYLFTSKGGVVACPGDSGGPLLMQLEDGSWRTVGIASTLIGYPDQCGTKSDFQNRYVNAWDAALWVQKETGIDITPCFEDDGSWSPTKDCGKFFAGEPSKGHGTWADRCKGTPVSGMSASCGDPFDETPPQVTIVSPAQGAIVARPQDPKADDQLIVKVDAKDDVGVASVELTLDGKAQPLVEKAPFVVALAWSDLLPGDHEISALARDKAGNEAMSEVVAFTVEIEKEEPSSQESQQSQTDSDGGSSKSEGGGASKSEKSSSPQSSQTPSASSPSDESGASPDSSPDEDSDANLQGAGCSAQSGRPGLFAGLVLLCLAGCLRRRKC